MCLKTFKPTTPSLRSRRIIKTSSLWSGSPYKPLTKGLRKKGGRNNQGRITVHHRGGGSKHTYRFIDFKQNPLSTFKVERIEYDPNRSSFIALIKEVTHSTYSYILASEGLTPGMTIYPLSLSSTLPLSQIPIGSPIHNIETFPGSGGKLKRAAGTFATLMSLHEKLATLSISSTQTITLSDLCKASLGKVSNSNHKNYIAGKAGVTRWLGHRPIVKGNSMNPMDHPHGGKTKRGFLPLTPWGKITRGGKKK